MAIVIHDIEHLARAMLADAEESFYEECKASGMHYHMETWDDSHQLTRDEYTRRAERVVELVKELGG